MAGIEHVGQHIEFTRDGHTYSGFIEKVVQPTGAWRVRVPGQWELIHVWPSQCTAIDTVALKKRIKQLEDEILQLRGIPLISKPQ